MKVQSVKNIIHPLNFEVLGFSLSSLYVNWHCLSLTLMWKCFLDIVLNCYEISKKKICPVQGLLAWKPNKYIDFRIVQRVLEFDILFRRYQRKTMAKLYILVTVLMTVVQWYLKFLTFLLLSEVCTHKNKEQRTISYF